MFVKKVLIVPPKPPYVCELLKVLLSKHRYGSPFPKEAVISMAAVPGHGIGDAKDTFDTIRKSAGFPFVENRGPDLVKLDNSNFPELVDYLHEACGWPSDKIDDYVRHYDVAQHHTFEE